MQEIVPEQKPKNNNNNKTRKKKKVSCHYRSALTYPSSRYWWSPRRRRRRRRRLVRWDTRERDRDRDTAAIVSVQIPATVWNEMHWSVFAWTSEYSSAVLLLSWDSAHVMCATPDALNVVSFLYFLPFAGYQAVRLHVCSGEWGRYLASGCELGQYVLTLHMAPNFTTLWFCLFAC